MQRLVMVLLTLGLPALLAPAALALTADDLLLVVNRNMPEGRVLAELYARGRGVPGGRIVEIPLPVTEEVDAEQYDEHIAPAVRRFIESNGLRDRIKCLVTFYGVPLRLRERPFTAAEQAELAELQAEVQRVRREMLKIVTALEDEARKQPAPATSGPAPAAPAKAAPDPDRLARRAEGAFRSLEAALSRQDEAGRRRLMGFMLQVMEALAGPAGLVDRLQAPADSPQAQQLREVRAKVAAASKEAAALQGEQHTLASRKRLRELVRANFGLIAYAKLINSHLEILNPAQTAAAVDSELALLWWDDYPRARWMRNPMVPPVLPGDAHPPVLMVSRLDAPSPLIVRRMILDALAAEQSGLEGKFLIDAGGSLTLGAKGARPDEYSKWDDYLRNLARIAREKSALQVVLDEAPGVVPATSRVDDVALYCGWYSVRNYVPGMRFARGAIAMHIASFEAVSLRGPDEKGWVAGVLRDGAVATIGPVAEPFLQTFPRPDELFPLLLDGELTLAEAYWRTTPTASWMMVLFGDPLYRPFAAKPAPPAR